MRYKAADGQHIWRNLGIIFGLWISSAFLGMLSLTVLPMAGESKRITLFKRGGGRRYVQAMLESANQGAPRDEEDGGITQQGSTGTAYGTPLARWGTSHNEVAPREWPALARVSSVCSGGADSAGQARLKRQATVGSGILTPMIVTPRTSGSPEFSDSVSQIRHQEGAADIHQASGRNTVEDKVPKPAAARTEKAGRSDSQTASDNVSVLVQAGSLINPVL